MSLSRDDKAALRRLDGVGGRLTERQKCRLLLQIIERNKARQRADQTEQKQPKDEPRK